MSYAVRSSASVSDAPWVIRDNPTSAQISHSAQFQYHNSRSSKNEPLSQSAHAPNKKGTLTFAFAGETSKLASEQQKPSSLPVKQPSTTNPYRTRTKTQGRLEEMGINEDNNNNSNNSNTNTLIPQELDDKSTFIPKKKTKPKINFYCSENQQSFHASTSTSCVSAGLL
jgi:hypothetical protein